MVRREYKTYVNTNNQKNSSIENPNRKHMEKSYFDATHSHMNNRKIFKTYLVEILLYSITIVHQILKPITKAILTPRRIQIQIQGLSKINERSPPTSFVPIPNQPTPYTNCQYHNTQDMCLPQPYWPNEGKQIQNRRRPKTKTKTNQ